MNFEILKKMPKLEMHIHLEGTLSLDLIEQLANKHNVALPRPKEKFVQFKDLAEFLELLNWICALVYTKEDARAIAYNYAKYASDENVMYAEVIVNPTHWKNLEYPELIEGVLEGFDEAYADGYADCRLLVSLLRSQTRREALELVRWMKANEHARLIGLSVDGNEAASTESNRILYPAFCEAKAAGFGITVHAGESSSADGVREAIHILGAMRIDHGVRAITDEDLLKELVEKQIALNITPTSNLFGLFESYEDHPLNKLYQMGIPVTIGTDDPELMDITLNEELRRAGEAYGWTLDDFVKIQKNAIHAAFCDDEMKAVLEEKLNIFYRTISAEA